MAGILHALQEVPEPLSGVDLMVGISAGSVLAAALRCGVTLDEITAMQHGDTVPMLRTRVCVTWTRVPCRRGRSCGPGRPG